MLSYSGQGAGINMTKKQLKEETRKFADECGTLPGLEKCYWLVPGMHELAAGDSFHFDVKLADACLMFAFGDFANHRMIDDFPLQSASELFQKPLSLPGRPNLIPQTVQSIIAIGESGQFLVQHPIGQGDAFQVRHIFNSIDPANVAFLVRAATVTWMRAAGEGDSVGLAASEPAQTDVNLRIFLRPRTMDLRRSTFAALLKSLRFEDHMRIVADSSSSATSLDFLLARFPAYGPAAQPLHVLEVLMTEFVRTSGIWRQVQDGRSLRSRDELHCNCAGVSLSTRLSSEPKYGGDPHGGDLEGVHEHLRVTLLGKDAEVVFGGFIGCGEFLKIEKISATVSGAQRLFDKVRESWLRTDSRHRLDAV
jgi:hypothetical protein